MPFIRYRCEAWTVNRGCKLLVGVLVLVGVSGLAGAATERYVGQAAWLSSSVATGCDVDANVGGACFAVPDGATSVDVTVDDGSGLAQAAYVTFQPAASDVRDNVFDTSGDGEWICGSGSVDVPTSGADVVRVAVGDPVVGAATCDSIATTGTITATFP